MTIRRAILSLSVLVLAAEAARANPQVYEKTLHSTAWVVSPLPKDRVSSGTGTLVDARKKWVLTNYHVVEDRDKVLVFFPSYQGGKSISDPRFYVGKNIERLAISGKVINRDKKRDLALIELKSLPAGVPELPLALQSVRPGETVHAIGNSGYTGPNAESVLWRYSRGEVRQVYKTKFKAKAQGGGSVDVEAVMVETQAPTNPGDSGGPVVNSKGELVGVTQSHDLKLRLVSFSVDVQEVKAFLRTARSSVVTTVRK
jgi:S1-C subfamily serine protease